MGPSHRGGTTGNLGLTWGWRTLSARAGGAPGAARRRTPCRSTTTSTFMEKVAVLMRDGNNQFHDNDTEHLEQLGPGVGLHLLWPHRDPDRIEQAARRPQRRAAGRAILDCRKAATCTAMKAAGHPDRPDHLRCVARCHRPANLFYQLPDDAGDVLLRADLTPPLAAAFRAIGGQLANLRIVE